MKLLTFLMTDNTIRKHLTDDKGLVALCELCDSFRVLSKEESSEDLLAAVEELIAANEGKFSAGKAKYIVEGQIEDYINEATGETSYYYTNALNKFNTFFDVIGEPKDGLLAQVSRSATSYD